MTSSKEQLRHEYVGTSLSDPSHCVSSPAAVLDLATLETNCKRMLEAVETLGLEWRPHIKTHKVRYARSFKHRVRACKFRELTEQDYRTYEASSGRQAGISCKFGGVYGQGSGEHTAPA